MYKKTIKYTDYDGNEREEDFYFNLNKAELAELELSVDGGFAESIQKIVNAKSAPEIVAVFKRLVLLSYGEKSADGKRFIKIANDGHKLCNDFAQTEAYSELFMTLASNADAASDFVNGIMPKDMNKEAAVQNSVSAPALNK